MALITGIPIVLRKKNQVGKNAFGEPVYEFEDVTVENVLVAPTSADDIVTTESLYGKKAVYTLGIPKEDTNDWTDATVVFFGQEWHTFGIPLEGIDSLIPLDWNKKVIVERYG